jgi:hypothetical protein
VNYLELQDEALHDDFGATKYRAFVKRRLNEAVGRVRRRLKLPEAEAGQSLATVAGTGFYALNGDVVRVRSLHFSGEPGALEQVDLRDIDDAPAASGRPSNYAFNGAGVTLYPTPDGAYSLELRYWSNAAAMSEDTDVPAIPEDYHPLLVTYTRAFLFRAEDDGEMYAFYMSQFEEELRLMRADVQDRGGGVKRTPNMWQGTPAPRFVRP